MIFDIGLPEFMVLAMLALIVFGPDRLPGMAAQAARALKSLRAKASAATAELSSVVDTQALTDIAGDIAKLNPRGMVTSAVLGAPAPQAQVSMASALPSVSVRADFDPDAT